MDPVWLVSLGTLIVAIGTAVWAVRRPSAAARRNGATPEGEANGRLSRMEQRIGQLDKDKERLAEDLRSCERERIRLLEMLFQRQGE